jgi:hypothetical protein
MTKRQQLAAIKAELAFRIECAGPDRRDDDRLTRDAEWVYRHRHEGIEVETLCMIITDLEFALRARAVEPPRAPCHHEYNKYAECQTTGERFYVCVICGFCKKER